MSECIIRYCYSNRNIILFYINLVLVLELCYIEITESHTWTQLTPKMVILVPVLTLPLWQRWKIKTALLYLNIGIHLDAWYSVECECGYH